MDLTDRTANLIEIYEVLEQCGDALAALCLTAETLLWSVLKD